MNINKITKLIEFDTATVSNGLGALKVRDDSYGYTGPSIRYLSPQCGPRVGVAVTGRMDTTSPGTEDNESLFVLWLEEFIKQSEAEGGEPIPVFAVLESVGLRPEYTVTIGDGMGTRMMLAGAVGFITNGCVRDIEGLRNVPLPCWGAGLSPMHGQIRWLDINSPVVIDGMTVKTGDFIHADENGAVVIPRSVADQVYDEAKQVQDGEAELFKTMGSPEFNIKKWVAENK